MKTDKFMCFAKKTLLFIMIKVMIKAMIKVMIMIKVLIKVMIMIKGAGPGSQARAPNPAFKAFLGPGPTIHRPGPAQNILIFCGSMLREIL